MNQASVLQKKQTQLVAIVGNPNSGKSTLFNALTGLRQKIANYPGVTVEKKEGSIRYDDGRSVTVLDLPGTYSLTPGSPDEKIAVDTLLGTSDSVTVPDAVICVVDAGNLERHLYLATQIIDTRLPVIIALNMIDTARENGTEIRIRELEAELGVPVVATVAISGEGIDEIRSLLRKDLRSSTGRWRQHLPEIVGRELDELKDLLLRHHALKEPQAFLNAIHLLSTDDGVAGASFSLSPVVTGHLQKDRERLDFLEIDRHRVFVESRYAWIRQLCSRAIVRNKAGYRTLSDRIDAVLLHRIWGVVIFLAVMALMFQSIFIWASAPMEAIGDGFDRAGGFISQLLPPGDLRDLLIDGALSGVAAVVMFLPQILFLFFFLGLLEDTGYMARAALMMDRVMGKVGLQGKSFIPLLSSFACAIPGIMATRTIENSRDRLVTMLVAPLMSCSARIPVYTLLIAAFVPNIMLLGFLSLPGLVLLGLYVLGFGTAMLVAWTLKKIWPQDGASVFILELPAYRRPSLKTVFIEMWDRSLVFLKQAGTIILGVSIILWFLATYPRAESASPSDQISQSFAGRAGQLIEPIIKPLGFDWKIGIGLIGSILQREVFVSTMGTIYNIGDADSDQGSLNLQKRLQSAIDPETGKPAFTLLTALCLMVYYAFAMQCMSTVAVMRRETNGWKWPLLQLSLMTAIAYGATFIVYRTGIMMGLGG
jgi:ferrous iron transport protein B